MTGRQLDDLRQVFPEVSVFDRVIAENGALLYRPQQQEVRMLAQPPAPEFSQALRRAGVEPIFMGRVVVATVQPNETAAAAVIRNLGLDLRVILNKGSVMILPSSIDKASGLAAALAELGIPSFEVVAAGDAENDQAMLDVCGYGAAVANATEDLRREADFVTRNPNGAGVRELIDSILEGPTS